MPTTRSEAMIEIPPYKTDVKDGWIDAFGHLNEGYYLVAFSEAGWHIMDALGIGVPYTEQTGLAFYTVESHVRYLNEVKRGATLAMESLTFGVDRKRWHAAQVMTVDGVECATAEFMSLHLDTKQGRTAPMSDDVYERLVAQVEPECPDWAGRRLAIPNR